MRKFSRQYSIMKTAKIKSSVMKLKTIWRHRSFTSWQAKRKKECANKTRFSVNNRGVLHTSCTHHIIVECRVISEIKVVGQGTDLKVLSIFQDSYISEEFKTNRI